MKRLFSRWRTRAHPPGDLTCRELVELVSDYLDGELPDSERARFEAHIDGCEACTAYVHQMRMTLLVVGAIPPESISPDAERELLAAFRGWKSGGPDGGPE